MNTLSFMTANYIGQQSGYTHPADATLEWATAQDTVIRWFAPRETYAARLGAVLDAVRAAGFGTVDLWLGHLDPAWSADHVAIACEELARRGMDVSSLAGWFGGSREALEAYCRMARAVGTRILGGACGYLDVDRADAVAVLKDYDIVLALENHPEKNPSALLAKIGDGADGHVGAALDTGWFATQGFDPVEAIRALRPHIALVHLKDVREAGKHATCALGDGIARVRGCVGALQESGYTGGICIEHEPGDRDPMPECITSLARVREWLGEGKL